MPRTVAVLSDVHGVLPVLEAVLAEQDVRQADLVVVTGDHAAGPQPVEVLDRLTGLRNGLLVRGNADRELVALADGGTTHIPDPIAPWAAGQLRFDQVELLRRLPHPVVIDDVDGFGSVLFCHGSPRDDDEVVLVDTRLDRWAEALAAVPGHIRTIVCGHTHMPFTRLVDRRMVINPGSIGMPYGRAGGNWALLEDGNVTLRHTRIDVDAAVAAVARDSGYEHAEEWADDYVRSHASDRDAIEAFGPRDGRTPYGGGS